MAGAAVPDTELRYVDCDGVAVTTTVGAVDPGRLSTALPVRRIRSRPGQRHYPGLFWSATTGDHVPYESRLELDRLWLADFDPTVVWIAAQPMWLSGRDGAALAQVWSGDWLVDLDRPVDWSSRVTVLGQAP